MSLDEFLFGRFHDFLKNRKKKKSLQNSNEIRLSEIQNKLTLLGRAVTGRSVNIYQAEKEGGVRGDNFFLPEKSDHFTTPDLNLKFYYFRILYLSIQQQLGIYFSPQENIDTNCSSEAVKSSGPNVPSE